MTALLTKAIQKIQDLPNDLQDETAEQLLENIENELKWHETLAKPQTKLEKIAELALRESEQGKTKKMAFDDMTNC